MTTITAGAAATALSTPREDRVSEAARHLYEAEFALHIARQSGVDAWIMAAYDHLHPAVIEYEAALAASAEAGRGRQTGPRHKRRHHHR
jgi:hypothetical protein